VSLTDAIHTLLGDTTPTPSKILNVLIDLTILPELYQYLLNVSLSYSVSGLNNCYNSRSIGWIKEVVFGERNTLILACRSPVKERCVGTLSA
jgi:hypothetical protein